MYKPARISTHCPQCAGELGFDEGSNAVKCLFCQSALLVTGYGRILSYFLPPTMKEEDVRRMSQQHLAAQGQKGRIGKIQLVFVPFYRLIGLDFRWSWSDKIITSPLLPPSSARSSALGFKEELGGPGFGPLPPLKEKIWSLTTAYLDRTLLAAGPPSLKLRSLGVRSQVLTLYLFDSPELSRSGQVIPVAMDGREAWSRVVNDLTLENVIHRQIINRILSLIFFPLWEVRVEQYGQTSSFIFDGVAQSLLQREATSPFFPEASRDGSFSAQTLRFRPLNCPNCGWGLPVEPSFRLFSCPTCHRVWHIRGDDFEGLPYRLAIPQKEADNRRVRYLPFWIFLGQVQFEGKVIANKYDLSQIAPLPRLLSEEERAIPLRFFIPAFKVRDLAVVNRLSTSFTRMQPVFQTREPRGEELHPGGILDRDEAANFAHLCLVSLVPKGNARLVERVARVKLTLSPGELVFLPFREHIHSLREDFLGTAIHLNTL